MRGQVAHQDLGRTGVAANRKMKANVSIAIREIFLVGLRRCNWRSRMARRARVSVTGTARGARHKRRVACVADSRFRSYRFFYTIDLFILPGYIAKCRKTSRRAYSLRPESLGWSRNGINFTKRFCHFTGWGCLCKCNLSLGCFLRFPFFRNIFCKSWWLFRVELYSNWGLK